MIEIIKLVMAGLMVIFDIFGVNGSSQLVLNMAQAIGIPDTYQMVAIPEQEIPEKIPEIVLNLPAKIPVVIDPLKLPIIEASSYLVMDSETSTVLVGKNINERRAMASVTKLMTALVALDKLDLDQIVTVSPEDTNIEPNNIWLIPGEQISAKELLYGLLIESGNDAALALARAGGNGSVDDFVAAMNEKAIVLGLNNSHFANPHGLDQENHFMSAKDLALIAKYAMKNPVIREIVGIKDTSIQSVDGSITHSLKNTNQLLGSYLNVQGIKTGLTDNAGLVLVSMAVGKDGNEIICVVMDSPDRFQESKILIDWAFGNFVWE